MTEWIVPLRGVMPTGRNKVPMARAVLEAARLREVRMGIQNGNVIARSRRGQVSLERCVHEVIRDGFGGDIAVLARPVDDVRAAIDRNPFPEASSDDLYYTLLARPPDPVRLQALPSHEDGLDRIAVKGDRAHAHYAGAHRDTRLNNAAIERKLGLPATTRIGNTIHRLLAMCGT